MTENGKQPAFTQQGNFDYAPIPGLTKREYFAGLAMQAFFNSMCSQEDRPAELISSVAQISVDMADELLKNLEE